MKALWIFLIAMLAILIVGVLFWLGQAPGHDAGEPSANGGMPAGGPPGVLHVGLVPERDIFAQNKRYKALAGYLSQRLGQAVEIVTLNTYEAVLQEFAEKRLDAAFLGSLVAVLAMDRQGVHVLVKPEYPGQVSTYRGVIFVREDSEIKALADVAGHSIAMVRTTTAGSLFPSCLMARDGLLAAGRAPKIVWAGTHDDVATAVMEGRVDVGAIKDLRLEEAMRSHPEWKIRRLATGPPVPENALVVRADLPLDLRDRLADLLLKMDGDDGGRKRLLELGLTRFVPCQAQEYAPIYDMTEQLGTYWDQTGVAGPPPRRPATRPASGPT